MKDSIVVDMRYAGYDIGQLAWEKHYIVEHKDVSETDAREAFRKRYGKSYL